MSEEKRPKQRRFVIETVVFAAVAISIVIIFSPEEQPFKTESLLLVVVIFGIYLVFTGRVTEFGFENFRVKIRDTIIESLDSENSERAFQSETSLLSKKEVETGTKTAARPEEGERSEGMLVDEDEIKEKIESEYKKELYGKRKIRILKIYKDKYHYKKAALLAYLERYDYVVFLEELPTSNKDERLSGFASAHDLIKILNMKDGYQVENNINQWNLHSNTTSDVIKKGTYIVNGVSRRQALKKLKNEKLNVLPVVSENMYYEGIVERDHIVSQILSDLSSVSPSNISPLFEELSEYLRN